MTNDRDTPLSPTPFAPAEQMPTESATPAVPRLKGWLPAGLATLALLWVVVFFLPEWVENRELDTTDDIANPATATTTTPSTGVDDTPRAPAAASSDDNGRSPFAEAQLAKARRAAQDILQPLLELQEYLLERGANDWARDAYSEALAMAESGDQAYRVKDFAAATEAYQQATLALEALEARLPDEVSARKQRLRNHIEALEPDAADTAFEQLQIMAPDDGEVADLAQRLAVLPELIREVEAAKALLEQDLDAAVAAVERAVAIDPLHQNATDLRDDYRARQRQRNFQRAMTTGYDALSGESFAAAERAFRSAAKLKPGAPEPTTALEELETARTAAQLRSMRDDARALEQQEDWQGALGRYREALEIDSALLFAKEGVARTAPRAKLMATVSEILDAPERLVDAAALREARSVLRELEALEDSGSIYRQQREALRSTLQTAATPIPVTLQSDGVTDVTIARVQRLGTFEQQVLSLRPGTYTAVGIRNGFRDVRIEFSVDPEGDMSPVDVRCVEAL